MVTSPLTVTDATTGWLIPAVCLICGADFKAKRSKLAIGKGKCCSTRCGAIARWRQRRASQPAKFFTDGRRMFGSTTTRECLQCGESFVALVSRIRQGAGRFCSRVCVGRFYKDSNFGEKSHRWTKAEAAIVSPLGGKATAAKYAGIVKVPYYKREPFKTRAHRMVHNHVVKGALVRQPCADCGSNENIHGHHEDYARPLDVVWLCSRCHRFRHVSAQHES